MKQLFALIIMLGCYPLTGQVDSSIIKAIPTTLEEYNYMTKGYRIQMESGLDMKKGYSIEKLGTHLIGDFTFTVMKLIHEEGRLLAGIMVISEGHLTGKKFYSAIPINNPELMKVYGADISKWDKNLIADYSQLISLYLSNYIYAAHSTDISTKE